MPLVDAALAQRRLGARAADRRGTSAGAAVTFGNRTTVAMESGIHRFCCVRADRTSLAGSSFGQPDRSRGRLLRRRNVVPYRIAVLRIFQASWNKTLAGRWTWLVADLPPRPSKHHLPSGPKRAVHRTDRLCDLHHRRCRGVQA